MSTGERNCVGGRWMSHDPEAALLPCTHRHRHLDRCSEVRRQLREWLGRDIPPDDVLAALDVEQVAALDCGGCLPREATSGWLCDWCHERLQGWLGVGPDGVEAVYQWLTVNLAPASSSAARGDWQRPSRGDDLPSTMREQVYDCRQLLADRLVIAQERAADAGVALMPTGVFQIAKAARWLRRYQLRIEEDPLLVGEMFRHLQDSMVAAHRLVPWRAEMTKVRGKDGPIPCPHCERKALVVRGGSEFVECRACGAAIGSARFSVWTEMIKQEGA